MKIRSDFVTNSSSSSFILAFNSEDDVDSVKKDLPQYWNDTVLDNVVNDIKSGIISKEDAIGRYKEGISTWHLYFKGKQIWDYLWQDQDDETTEVGKFIKDYKDNQAKEFIEKIKDSNVFSLIEYSDNDGELYSNLEHEVMPYLSNTVGTINNH